MTFSANRQLRLGGRPAPAEPPGACTRTAHHHCRGFADLISQAMGEVQANYPAQPCPRRRSGRTGGLRRRGQGAADCRQPGRQRRQVLASWPAGRHHVGAPGCAGGGRRHGRCPNVVIRVRDHGPGIPAQRRDRLFQRFGRLEGSRTRSGRVGTGLGLYLSRQLARAMHGDIALESTGPGGSVFRLRLPAA